MNGESAKCEVRSAGIRRIVRGCACLPLLAAWPVSRLSAANPPATNNSALSLQPPHDLLLPGFWEQYHWSILIVGAGLLVLAVAFVWVLCRPKPPVVVPPEVTARQALQPLLRQTEDGAVLSQVSQALRRYVAAAFRLPPGEMTTTEFCRLVERQDEIGQELGTVLCAFLRECDERKFAPTEMPPGIGTVPRALQLVEALQARRALTRLAVSPGKTATAQPA